MNDAKLENRYKIFEDERRFQPLGKLHPDHAQFSNYSELLKNSIPNTYKLNNNLYYWFDGKYNRIATSDPRFYVQMLSSADFGDLQRRVFVAVNGRRIQFSRKNNTTLKNVIRESDLHQFWLIEEIGSPLNIYTVFRDQRNNYKRLREERKQCLTNASKFANAEDQSLSISLIKAVFETYRNPFSGDALFNREVPGVTTVEFSDLLKQKIEAGCYVDV